jgi:hypothetical protein
LRTRRQLRVRSAFEKREVRVGDARRVEGLFFFFVCEGGARAGGLDSRCKCGRSARGYLGAVWDRRLQVALGLRLGPVNGGLVWRYAEVDEAR